MDGNRTMEYLRTQDIPTVDHASLSRGGVAFSRLTFGHPGHGMSLPHQAENALMLSLQLRDYKGRLWLDRKEVEVPWFRKGEFTVYDFRREWQADLKTAFDCVNIHIPNAAWIHHIGDEYVDVDTLSPLVCPLRSGPP